MSRLSLALLLVSTLAILYFGVYEGYSGLREKEREYKDKTRFVAMLSRVSKSGGLSALSPFADDRAFGEMVRSLAQSHGLRVTREVYGARRKGGTERELRLETEGPAGEGLSFLVDLTSVQRPLRVTESRWVSGPPSRLEIRLDYRVSP